MKLQKKTSDARDVRRPTAWLVELPLPRWIGLPGLFVMLAAFSALAITPDEAVKNPRKTSELQEQPWEVRSREALDLTALDRPIDPAIYLVGPGDELTISVWGRVQGVYTVVVSPEVSALVPTVGEISLRGMVLARAKETILRRMNDIYPNVTATVTLTRVRTLRVPVTGVVKNPGIYLVTANVRASEAIETAGWEEASSRRRIMLLRGRDTLRVDVQRFALAGDESCNPYLAEGDVILVGQMSRAHDVFEINGAVNRAGTFEFVPGDRLGEAIRLALGFAVEADTTALELIRFTGEDSSTFMQVIDLRMTGPDAGRNLALQPDDRVFVRPRVDYRAKASMRVEGEVVRPGSYSIQNGQTLLSEVLRRCGGVTERADPSRAALVRANRFQLDAETDSRVRAIPLELLTNAEREWLLAHSLSEPGQVSLDLEGLLSTGNPEHDLPLWDGDVITIPRFLPQVNVIGRIRRPGLIPYEPDRDLDYYVQRAGGLSWRADASNIFIVKGSTGTPLLKKKVKTVDAGDTIVIPTVREKKFWPLLRDAMAVMGNIATLYLVVNQATK